jgi:hypothetical protein
LHPDRNSRFPSSCEDHPVMRRWRPFAAAAGCLTLGGCEYSETSGCWESSGTTTTPDWVFGLLFGAGSVALLAGLVWVGFLFEQRPAPMPKPVSRTLLGVNLVGLTMGTVGLALSAVSIYRSPELWETEDAIVLGGTLALAVVPVAAVFAGLRKFRRTGRWPVRRAAPWAMFWILPVLAVTAAVTSAGALGAMIASIEVTSSGPC